MRAALNVWWTLQELENERMQEEGLAKKFPDFGPGDTLELKLVRICLPTPLPHPDNNSGAKSLRFSVPLFARMTRMYARTICDRAERARKPTARGGGKGHVHSEA